MTRKKIRKKTYLVPVVVEGRAMEEIMKSMQLRASCGICAEVGCSWCNASVPGVLKKILIVAED